MLKALKYYQADTTLKQLLIAPWVIAYLGLATLYTIAIVRDAYCFFSRLVHHV